MLMVEIFLATEVTHVKFGLLLMVKIGLICIHKMIGGELDSGDIISRDYLNINNNKKLQRYGSGQSHSLTDV